MWALREAGSENIRRVPVRSSLEVQQSETKRLLVSGNVGVRLRKGLRETGDKFGSQDLVG